MPIKFPDDLPARKTLEREGVMLMAEDDAVRQDIRPLRIGLLNLMPDKIRTETQFARLIGATPLQVELTLVKITSHTPKNTSAEHMLAFYRRLGGRARPEVRRLHRHRRAGRTARLRGRHLLERAAPRSSTGRRPTCTPPSTSAGARRPRIYHFHGVPKHTLPRKAFGVYRHRNLNPASPYLRGFSDDFSIPVSRWTEVRPRRPARATAGSRC